MSFSSRGASGRLRAALGARPARTAVLACIVAVGSSMLTAGGDPQVASVLQASAVQGDPGVGALFADPTTAQHGCTGTVLDAAHDLVLTAAHCVVGTGAGMRFVPGYNGTAADSAPFGVWSVDRVWAAAGWLAGQEPAHDLAVLQVDSQPFRGGPIRSVDQVTGGHPVVVTRGTGDTATSATGPVTVVAYNAGDADSAVACTVGASVDPVPMSFNCGGYFAGTSGAPWLLKSTVKHPARVVGIIGGPYQGGCTDAVSYSPSFDDQLTQLLARAVSDLPGDDIPAAGDDGC